MPMINKPGKPMRLLSILQRWPHNIRYIDDTWKYRLMLYDIVIITIETQGVKLVGWTDVLFGII